MQFHTLSATLHRGPREVTSLESTPRDLGDICAIAGRLSKDEGPWALETADGGWRHGPEARDGPSCLPLFPAQPGIPVYKPSSFYFYRILRINWKLYMKSTSPVLDWHLMIGGYCL